MIAKTTGNLIGANVAMDEIRTPMKVFKEARARGDTATMKRAMGYVEAFNEDAWEYKTKADEALKQEAVEAKEKERLEREELAERIKENRTETEEKLEEASKSPVSEPSADTSEENDGDVNTDSGIELSTEHTDGEQAKSASDIPVTYTKTGKTVPSNPEIKFSVTV